MSRLRIVAAVLSLLVAAACIFGGTAVERGQAPEPIRVAGPN